MKKKIVIIGSGFSSLSAASYLAKKDFDVHVYEKNETLGGRARQLKKQGFTFDMGPSWYWMPDVFESFYNDFGKSTNDFYKLNRLDPGYQVVFGENEIIKKLKLQKRRLWIVWMINLKKLEPKEQSNKALLILYQPNFHRK